MERKIAYDNSSTAKVSKASSLNWVHTVGSGINRMLVVAIAIEDGNMLHMNVKAVKFGNVEMNYISNSSVAAGVSSAFNKTLLYYLPNPAPGQSAIAIDMQGPCMGISAVAISLFGVYQGVPEAVAVNKSDVNSAAELTAYINTVSKNAWVIDAGGSTKVAAEPGRHSISWSSAAAGYMTISCAAFAPAEGIRQVSVAYRPASTCQAFGVRHLEHALLNMSILPVKIDISESTGSEDIIVKVSASAPVKSEGFRITRSGKSIIIEASDEAGAMYGLLEMGEKIQIYGIDGVENCQVEPSMAFRAVKHNTPWSSYRKDFAQDQHYDTMLDTSYWESFLGMMAENRYNTLTIWTQHPFPYMIRPANFPKATPFTDEELSGWKFLYGNIFRMARELGIEVYIINWNIYVSEAFREHYDANANADTVGHLGDVYNTPQIEQYTKECITQMLNEYPDLTGFGFTLGEYMGKMTADERAQWALRTIIEGIKAADRPAKLIYRMPLSADTGSGGSTSKAVEVMTRNAIEALTGLVSPIETETKFNWSHGHSSTKLIQVHGGGMSTTFWEPLPENYRMNWMIRNEDFFILRWGQTDFIRGLIRSNGQPYVGGCYIGSECYYPALNYIDIPRESDNRTNYAFQRQWLFYMAWGRLLYNSETTDLPFELAFDKRYGKGMGSKLLKAYKLAGSFPQMFGSFIFSTWDFTSYAEGFLCPVMAGGYDDGKSYFLSLEELMDHKVLDPDYISIKDYVYNEVNRKPLPEGKITPLQLADTLDQNAEEALNCIRDIKVNQPALQDETGDIQAWAYLSRYFADKLRAGVALESYSLTKDPAQKDSAVSYAQKAKLHWQGLITVTKPRYKPVRLIHIRDDFSWENYMSEVERDITVARNY